MAEREHSDRTSHREYAPRVSPAIVDVLRGVISDPIRTPEYKKGIKDKEVEVRIALDGPGHFGLTDWKDNKLWAGIFNHVLVSARYVSDLASRMQTAGLPTNPKRVLDGMIVSHAGRRQWEEAVRYPEAVEDADEKRSISNETLGLRLIHGKVSDDVFGHVAALAHGDDEFGLDMDFRREEWDYRLAIYVDHRTGQTYEPLSARMGDMVVANFFDESERTDEITNGIHDVVADLIERRKIEGVSVEEAVNVLRSRGVPNVTNRWSLEFLVDLILKDADTEIDLTNAGVEVDRPVSVPSWEHRLRLEYVSAAEPEIFLLSDEDLLPLTWWGGYVEHLKIESSQ